MITQLLELAGTIIQYYVNFSGGVLPDHECVIHMSQNFDLIVRDDMWICDAAWGR